MDTEGWPDEGNMKLHMFVSNVFFPLSFVSNPQLGMKTTTGVTAALRCFGCSQKMTKVDSSLMCRFKHVQTIFFETAGLGQSVVSRHRVSTEGHLQNESYPIIYVCYISLSLLSHFRINKPWLIDWRVLPPESDDLLPRNDNSAIKQSRGPGVY